MPQQVEHPVGGTAARAGASRLRIGPYVLTERIGQGGMAEVYRAVLAGPSGFEKTVVVKAMLPQLAQNDEFVELFTTEAKTTAQLSHPGIVQVHDFGVWNGIPFLVMEHLDGINLSQLMQAMRASGRRVPLGISLVIVTEMCHALGYAHAFRDKNGVRRQIIHSDVSPSNVMVCRDGSVKLLDFGVARYLDEFDFDLSVTLKGKFAYMAPEQVNRLPFDRRVDVFAAGIVLFELLTGKRLFAAQTELETLRRVNAAEVPSVRALNPEVSPELEAIVQKALSRDPGARFEDGEEMAAALHEVWNVGGGRRRVAEFLGHEFPHAWFVTCEVCGKQVVPGLACQECGTEARRELTASTDGTQPIDVSMLFSETPLPPPAPLGSEPAPPLPPQAPSEPPPPPPVAEAYAPMPRKPRPRSITQVVQPLKAVAVHVAPSQTRRGPLKRAALTLAVMGALFGVGAGISRLRQLATSEAHTAPRRAPAQTAARPAPSSAPASSRPRLGLDHLPKAPVPAPRPADDRDTLPLPLTPETPAPEPYVPHGPTIIDPEPAPERQAEARPAPASAPKKVQRPRPNRVAKPKLVGRPKLPAPSVEPPKPAPQPARPALAAPPVRPAPVRNPHDDALRIKDGKLLDPFGGGR